MPAIDTSNDWNNLQVGDPEVIQIFDASVETQTLRMDVSRPLERRSTVTQPASATFPAVRSGQTQGASVGWTAG